MEQIVRTGMPRERRGIVIDRSMFSARLLCSRFWSQCAVVSACSKRSRIEVGLQLSWTSTMLTRWAQRARPLARQSCPVAVRRGSPQLNAPVLSAGLRRPPVREHQSIPEDVHP